MNSQEPNFNTDNIFLDDNNDTNQYNNDDDNQNDNTYNSRDERNRIRPNRIRLSFEQEKKIQKLPSFTVGEAKRDRINSARYLNINEYKPFTLYNFPLFFWMVGLLFIAGDILLICNIILKKKNKHFIDGFYGKNFWEYIVIIVIF